MIKSTVHFQVTRNTEIRRTPTDTLLLNELPMSYLLYYINHIIMPSCKLTSVKLQSSNETVVHVGTFSKVVYRDM